LLWLYGNLGVGIKTKQNKEGNTMCHFLSWTEFEGKLYYLTADCLKDARGVELRKHLGRSFNEDVIGHGAIDFYWGLNGKGVHKEFTNFSSPDRLPDLLQQAFLNGEFRRLPVPYDNLAKQILCASAWKEYDKACDPAWKEYDKVRDAALKEYDKACVPALKEYDKACVPAPAWKEYDKACDAAWKEYKKACDAAFWKLVLKKKNRNEKWQ
jgi:hypothetical protein